MHFTLFIHALQLIARGGGGGSGGGGGGGGGSIIILIGYIPMHYVGKFFHSKVKNIAGIVLTMAICIAYASLWFFLGSYGIFVGIAALIGGPAGYYGWFGKVSASMRRKAQKEIVAAAANDPAWDEAQLNVYVRSVFMNFQYDWSVFRAANLKTYMTPRYEYHTQLMLAALHLRGRRNNVLNPSILEAYPVKVQNMPDNTHDRVTYFIHAKADDQLIETISSNEKLLYEDKSDFYEYWEFVRSGNTWMLDGISQLTENSALKSIEIEAFATANQLYYSPDWGWLLLPSRGQLFKGGKFGISDVNNHVIGQYHNIIVELYSYIPNPKSTDSNKSQYVIAQVALPKRYDSIIVEAKDSGLKSMFHKAPKGYNKLSLEWPDFNKRYQVYATNVEQVTAFELLHPVYMEKLFALPFKVSIEVVDNVVYLYTKDKKADYGMMYSILKDAFEEMKM